MPVRFPAALLFGALILFAPGARSAPPAGPSPASDLLGTWEPRKTSPEGIGVLFRAAPDGVLFVTFGAVVDGTWSFRDGVLRIAVNGEKSPQATETRIEGDVMVQKNGADEVKLRRLGAADPAASPIVGCWQGPPVGEGGPSPVIEFGRTGDVHVRIAMRSERGSWKVSGRRLTLSSPAVPERNTLSLIHI